MAERFFHSARALLGWAREDIEDLNAATEHFFGDHAYEVFHEIDPESGNIFLKVRVAEVPDYICKLASHALWDIKHALDHATCAAVREIRGGLVEDIHFPTTSHPNDLEAKLRATVNKGAELKYPVVLHDLFRSLEPYPTGNGYPGGGNEFVALSKLANTTKHSVALGTGARAHFTGAKGTGGIIKMYPYWWDSSKQELTLALIRAGTEMKMNIQLASYITFSDIKSLEGHPAGEVLNGFATCVESIISDLENAAFA